MALREMNDPVATYHNLLEDERIAQGSAEALHEGQRARRLVFGDRPVSITLRASNCWPRGKSSAIRSKRSFRL